MKLVDLVKNIGNVDEELIIFQENKEDSDSNIVLSRGEEADNGIKVENGTKYYYLIEVFLAKEFIDDWVQSLGFSPIENEIAKRLYDYAINDV